MLIQLIDEDNGSKDLLGSYHADWLPGVGCPVALPDGEQRFVVRMSARVFTPQKANGAIVQATCLHLSKTKPERAAERAKGDAEAASGKPKA